MASKFSRSAAAAVVAAGASGLIATSASAAVSIPTSLVNQPVTTGVVNLTPESATLTGAIDTGGNPLTTFTLPGGSSASPSTLSWDGGSFNLVNTSSSPVTEYVDGIPVNTSTGVYSVLGGSAPYTLPASGADNNSQILFEYDPAKDFAANGNAPGHATQFSSEVDVPTASGLSSTSATVGAYPAASGSANDVTPLTPGTKYYYWIVQQAGVTAAATTINTAIAQGATAPSATAVNPTYTCDPNSFIQSIAPYKSYTTTGTVSGGVTSSGTPQTTPQPEIQGPCLFVYGGSGNYYQSGFGSFTTPKLGSVAFTKTATWKGSKAMLMGTDNSVVSAKGKLTLTYKGKTVATGTFKAASMATSTVNLSLTSAGKKAVKKGSFTAKLTWAASTDQPTTTKTVKL